MQVRAVACSIVVFTIIGLAGLPEGRAAETIKTGGTFIVGLAGDPGTLNPVVASDAEMRVVVGNIFSRLVYSDQEGDYHGDLAEKWTVSKDNLQMSFELRKGLRWQDGRPVTAEDVKFSLECLAKYHPRGSELKKLAKINVLSNTAVELRFSSIHVAFFPFLDETGFIIPKHIYGSGDLTTHPANNKPVGSGPFSFQEWQKGDHITLVKNKDYFIPGEPYVDKAVFKIIPQAASRVLALETGDIDYLAAQALPNSDIMRLRKNAKFLVTNRGMGGGSSLMKMIINIQRKPWNDLRVRQAIALTIDRSAIVEKATFGLGLPAYSPFLQSNFPWAYNPEVEKIYSHDLAKAGALLNNAGYPPGPKGIRFTGTLIFSRGVAMVADTAEIMRQQLKEVGIDLVLQPLDKATVDEKCFLKYDYDLWMGMTTQGIDPSLGIERFYLTKKSAPALYTNANGYSNPRVDALFSAAKSTVALKERGRSYRQAQLLLMQDLPTLPLVANPIFAAFPKKVKGVNERRYWARYYAPSDAWFSP